MIVYYFHLFTAVDCLNHLHLLREASVFSCFNCFNLPTISSIWHIRKYMDKCKILKSFITTAYSLHQRKSKVSNVLLLVYYCLIFTSSLNIILHHILMIFHSHDSKVTSVYTFHHHSIAGFLFCIKGLFKTLLKQIINLLGSFNFIQSL